MSPLEGIALLLGLCAGIVLSGYWLASTFGNLTASERLAASAIAGIAVMVLFVSVVNLFVPLAQPWVLLGLIPAAITLAWTPSRRQFTTDLVAFSRDRESLVVVGLVGGFFAVLLWPILSDPNCLFYDASPNHDNFFWVASAEYLKRCTYLTRLEVNELQPLFNATPAIATLHPSWGRMATEGLLAFVASLAGSSPLKIHIYACSALYLPWVAAVFLVTKTYFNRKVSLGALAALAVFEPVFIFYYGNANLPNLFGAILGAGAVLATEHALRTPPEQRRTQWGWRILLALSVHGLLASYPEMVPFVAVPCGLLWLRGWWTTRSAARAAVWTLAGAGLAGMLLNPATTVRAWWGFAASFDIARANTNYGSLLVSLSPWEYLPALSSLSVPAASWLHDWLAAPLSVMLVAGLFLVLWRAQDRYGTLAIFSGAGLILLYTVITQFHYGWQKTVQFSGVFVAAAIPVGMLDTLVRERQLPDFRRWLAWLCTIALVAFATFATFMNVREVYKWSERKVMSHEWFRLRELSRGPLRDEAIVVDPASFRMAFFYGMWAPYFLPDSNLYFAARGEQNGGYLRASVAHEPEEGSRHARVLLLDRRWAEAFDSSTPPILTGREFALLRRANRVIDMRGVHPLNGVPDNAAARFSFTLRSNSSARFSFTLNPRSVYRDMVFPAGSWQVTVRSGSAETYRATVAGAPPWKIEAPLAADREQVVECAYSDPLRQLGETPFALTDLRLVATPMPLDPAGGRIDFSAGGNWENYHVSGLFSLGNNDAAADRPDAVMQFLPLPAQADVELQLIAYPRFPEGEKGIMPVELWFNDHLVFSSPFEGPGVLRARIPAAMWNENSTARIRLHFPQNRGQGLLVTPRAPVLVLRYLTTAAAAPMP